MGPVLTHAAFAPGADLDRRRARSRHVDESAGVAASCAVNRSSRAQTTPGRSQTPLRGTGSGCSRGCSKRARHGLRQHPAARPLPRRSSVGSALGTTRASCECSFQATITSQAGSPTPIDPQSITPLMRPSAQPVANIEVAVVPDRRALPRRRRERTLPLCRHGGVAVEPRQPVTDILVSLGQRDAAAGGAPVGSTCCNAATNAARSRAAWIASISSTGAVSPSTHL